MNLLAARLYAIDQMCAINKLPSEYCLEPMYVSPTEDQDDDGDFSINAYNELLILVDPENYYGVTIFSDNSVFDSDNKRNSGVHQFTGMIRFIKSHDGWSLSAVSIASGDIGGDVGSGTKIFGYVEFLRVVIY